MPIKVQLTKTQIHTKKISMAVFRREKFIALYNTLCPILPVCESMQYAIINIVCHYYDLVDVLCMHASYFAF